MPTYYGKASLSGGTTCRFHFRDPQIFTASASATATSTTSQQDADTIAHNTAMGILDNLLNTGRNNTQFAVNIANIGQQTFFNPQSSFIYDYLTDDGNNNYILNSNFSVPDGLQLRIKKGDTFTVPKGVTLTAVGKFTGIINQGKLNVNGTIEIGNRFSKSATLAPNAVTDVVTNTNTGEVNIYSGGSLVIDSGNTYDNNSDGVITLYGGFISNAGTFNNYGAINGQGQSAINNFGTFISLEQFINVIIFLFIITFTF
jgi:hypothetical protein